MIRNSHDRLSGGERVVDDGLKASFQDPLVSSEDPRARFQVSCGLRLSPYDFYGDEQSY